MKMPWEDDIDWGNIATTLGKENDMVTTDKVTVTEFAPYIGKTTTDYKENDMVIKATESGFNQTVQKDQATLIAELISRVTSLENTVEFILEQLEINDETDEEWYDWRDEQEYEDRWGGITDDNME